MSVLINDLKTRPTDDQLNITTINLDAKALSNLVGTKATGNLENLDMVWDLLKLIIKKFNRRIIGFCQSWNQQQATTAYYQELQ